MSEKQQSSGLRKVGALWKRTSKSSGVGYYGGSIELDGVETKLLLFKTRDKKQENSPDLTLHVAVDDYEQQQDDGPSLSDDIPF